MRALAARGQWGNTLRNALDGSEGYLARGDAARFWKELRTSEKRVVAAQKWTGSMRKVF